MDEIWKPVVQINEKLPDGQWKYEVSNLGRVRCVAYRDRDGQKHREKIYRSETVFLQVGNTRKQLQRHILVATAFLPNPEGFKTVLHKNGDSSNNCVLNLEWGRRKISTSRPVRQYDVNGDIVKEYISLAEASRFTGIPYAELYANCDTQSWDLVGGCIWRFHDKDEIATYGVRPQQEEIVEDFIRQYDKTGRLVAVFASVDEAGVAIGTNKQNILNCCYRINASCDGHIWRFKDDDEIATGASVPEIPTCKKAVRQYTLEKKLVAEYESVQDVFHAFGKASVWLYNCCNKKDGAYSCFGFLWRYVEDDELYEQRVL